MELFNVPETLLDLPPQHIVAIDPGDVFSALVEYSPCPDNPDGPGNILFSTYNTNEIIQDILVKSKRPVSILAIEMVSNYGMAVGKEVFRTCVWIGKFEEAWKGPVIEVLRPEEKLCLCKNPRAKDSNIRRAIIDIFGPGEERAIRGKRCPTCKGKGWVGKNRAVCVLCRGSGVLIPPGPLAGITGDLWSALAVAITAVHGLCGRENKSVITPSCTSAD